MNKPIIKGLSGPERKIQDAIKDMLTLKGWHVMETHGNMYQSGFPDLFACNQMYGQRWVEVKNPLDYCFTPAQLREFPKMCANGSGVWILVAADESEYQKLFKPFNWWVYQLDLNPRSANVPRINNCHVANPTRAVTKL